MNEVPEIPLPRAVRIAIQSVIEMARCLGVAQRAGDIATSDQWQKRLDEEVVSLRKIWSTEMVAPDSDWRLKGYAYASTQATTCAECGEHKHTPLRVDAMGGYVCLTCIDKKLGALLGEFGHNDEGQDAYTTEQGSTCIDWDDDPQNQLSVIVNDGRVTFAAYHHGEKVHGLAKGPVFIGALQRFSGAQVPAPAPAPLPGTVACWRIARVGDSALGLRTWHDGVPSAEEVEIWTDYQYSIELAYVAPPISAEELGKVSKLLERLALSIPGWDTESHSEVIDAAARINAALEKM